MSMFAAIGATLAALAPGHDHHRKGCSKLYTVAMGRRAGSAVYAGTRNVSLRELKMLGKIEKCQRHPTWYVRWFDHNQARLWRLRREPPFQGPVIASNYDDAGATACGFHATYGFASLNLPCGAHVLMRGPGGRTVTAIMQDRGPYIGGRTFDLNLALKAAIGCSDLCPVTWRLN